MSKLLEKSKMIQRFIDVTLVEEGQRYRVGSGTKSIGQIGRQVAVIALRHSGGYEIVMQMENGKIASFSPQQLFPFIEKVSVKECAA